MTLSGEIVVLMLRSWQWKKINQKYFIIPDKEFSASTACFSPDFRGYVCISGRQTAGQVQEDKLIPGVNKVRPNPQ